MQRLKGLISRHRSILFLVAASLLVGILTFRDYGESWDEADIYSYSGYALQAYARAFHAEPFQEFGTNLNYYGPSYFMGAALIARLEMFLIPSLSNIDAWHFVNFLSFVCGAAILYFLARRWMSDLAALGTSLLFLAQPLFWGHAFINPKDIPFMTFLMASIYLGLKMADTLVPGPIQARSIIGAGIALGLTIAFRVVGPLAGLLVGIYAFLKSPGRAAFIMVPYFLIAALTAYLTWPYLWNAPVAHFIESLRYMSKFPLSTPILFRGNLYSADQLPRSYVPTLVALQLTEPALGLFAAGSLLSLWNFAKNVNRELLLLLVGWLVLPMIWIIGLRSTLYDNFRQLFFLLPPMFILAGLALDFLFTKIRGAVPRTAILLAVLLPGLWSGVRLHPYEYVYYNSLIGGVRGAYRDFEMDYWAVSFREAAGELNAVAPANAKVVIFGPVHLFRIYARPDLLLYDSDQAKQSQDSFDYAVLYTRKNLDLRRCRGGQVIASIERDGAVLTFIKQLSPQSICP